AGVGAAGRALGEVVRAVTMRRVADELGFEAMSLYHHVADKNALLAGRAEAIVGQVAMTGAAIRRDDWRATVRARCLAARRIMLAHPWAPGLISQQTESPVTAFILFEELVGTLIGAGFDYDLAHRAIHSLGSMVLGFTHELFDPDPSTDDEVDEQAMLAMAEGMPHLLQLAQMGPHESDGSLSTCDTQAEFEFTVTLIIDGLAARRAALAGGN
ncbi:TetR/AcrR family transcriptional regulator C-terminal domain-containing protein, partial [Demequina sp.]|uniref:TetR/AcrR family transcriptional regulator n=1 Tax=Demequina sp. TaxID=2050685 RepID=UPI0025BBC3E6